MQEFIVRLVLTPLQGAREHTEDAIEELHTRIENGGGVLLNTSLIGVLASSIIVMLWLDATDATSAVEIGTRIVNAALQGLGWSLDSASAKIPGTAEALESLTQAGG